MMSVEQTKRCDKSQRSDIFLRYAVSWCWWIFSCATTWSRQLSPALFIDRTKSPHEFTDCYRVRPLSFAFSVQLREMYLPPKRKRNGRRTRERNNEEEKNWKRLPDRGSECPSRDVRTDAPNTDVCWFFKPLLENDEEAMQISIQSTISVKPKCPAPLQLQITRTDCSDSVGKGSIFEILYSDWALSFYKSEHSTTLDTRSDSKVHYLKQCCIRRNWWLASSWASTISRSWKENLYLCDNNILAAFAREHVTFLDCLFVLLYE